MCNNPTSVSSLLLAEKGFGWSEDKSHLAFTQDPGCGPYMGEVTSTPDLEGNLIEGTVTDRTILDNWPTFGSDTAVITLRVNHK